MGGDGFASKTIKPNDGMNMKPSTGVSGLSYLPEPISLSKLVSAHAPMHFHDCQAVHVSCAVK